MADECYNDYVNCFNLTLFNMKSLVACHDPWTIYHGRRSTVVGWRLYLE